MKLFILSLAIIATIVAAEFSADEKEAWKTWKLQHAKMFLSGDKEKARMKTFIKNKNDVDSHNDDFLNGKATWTKKLHKHSDLSAEEFLSRFGGVKMDDGANTNSTPVTLRGSYPSEMDLTKYAGVGPVRDQGQCGSCWTFSTCASIEYAYWIKTQYAGDLAEQNLVDCVYGSAGGCQGGWMYTAFDWIKNNGGIAWEWDYPYTATNGQCRASSLASKISVNLNKNQAYVQVAADDDSIKTAVSGHKVLSVCVDAYGWGSYSAGVYQDADIMAGKTPTCSHAVAIVGYGWDSTTRLYYYKIRNSWNTWWGEQGYIRMDATRNSYGTRNSGLMTEYAYYAVIA